MDRRYMVKQRIGQLTTSRGAELALYETGDTKWLLVDPLYYTGSVGTFSSLCAAFPIEKKKLNKDWKGWRQQLH